MSASWNKLKEKVQNCRRCALWRTRNKAVFGEGSLKRKIILIGEAPGRNEDLKGRPFVGAAGKVLDKMLETAGLNRKEIFITNVVKCRPPRNRDPLPEEVEACAPFLRQQLFLAQPRLVITLGRFALKKFVDKTITQVYGRARKVKWRFKDQVIEFVLFPTFHPAVALYRGAYQKLLEDDFTKLKRLVSKLIKK